jgi:hypothetical protein
MKNETWKEAFLSELEGLGAILLGSLRVAVFVLYFAVMAILFLAWIGILLELGGPDGNWVGVILVFVLGIFVMGGVTGAFGMIFEQLGDD